jgi:hypothetical protein
MLLLLTMGNARAQGLSIAIVRAPADCGQLSQLHCQPIVVKAIWCSTATDARARHEPYTVRHCESCRCRQCPWCVPDWFAALNRRVWALARVVLLTLPPLGAYAEPSRV